MNLPTRKAVLKALTADYYEAIDRAAELNRKELDAKLRTFAIGGCDKLRWLVLSKVGDSQATFLRKQRKFQRMLDQYNLFIVHTMDDQFWFARWCGFEDGWAPSTIRSQIVAVAPLTNTTRDELTAVSDTPIKLY